MNFQNLIIKPLNEMPIETCKRVFKYSMLLMLLIFITLAPHNINGAAQVDETTYGNIVSDWNTQGIGVLPSHFDTKPLSFLYIEKLFKADETILYTRFLNIVLIVSVTVLFYSLTKRKEAFLYLIIPIFLNLMWLTVEIIEVFFVVLALRYVNQKGLFIGLATLFRPYAILYSILINNTQRLYVLVIGALFSVVLIYYNLFIPYALHLFNYAATGHDFGGIDPLAISFWILMLVVGWKNKEMRKYSPLFR